MLNSITRDKLSSLWDFKLFDLRGFFLLFFAHVRMCVCVFSRRAPEISQLPFRDAFQSRGHDELVWNKLEVLTTRMAPASGYKLKQKQSYRPISLNSPWNTIRSASISAGEQHEKLLPLFPLFFPSQTIPRIISIFVRCFSSPTCCFLITIATTCMWELWYQDLSLNRLYNRGLFCNISDK